MQAELNTYMILIATAILLTVFFAIRKRIKKVIFLVVLIIILTAKAGSMHAALEYAKEYTDKTNIKLEQDENGIPNGITMEFPEIDFSGIDLLPEANYYNTETEGEQ